MEAVLNDTIPIPFTTKDLGAATNVDADSTPTVSIYEAGGSTAMTYTGETVVDRATAGVYAAPLALTAANGFEAGKYYEVWVEATIDAVDYGPEPVGFFKITSSGIDTVDTNVDAILVDTGTDIPASIAAIPTVEEIAAAVAVAGAPTLYAPTSAVRVVGDNEGGDYTSLAAHDEVSMDTGEVSGTGLEVTVSLSTSNTDLAPSLVRVAGHYGGSPSHSIEVYAYNYTLTAWEQIGTMLNRAEAFNYVFPMSSDNFDGSGAASLRFLHNVGSYNPSHVLHLDYVSWEKVATTNQLSADVAQIYALLVDVDAEVDTLADIGRKADYPTAITYGDGGGSVPEDAIETVTWASGAVWTYNYTDSVLVSVTEA